MSEARNGGTLHEPPDVDIRWVVGGTATLLGLIAAALILVSILFRFSGELRTQPSHPAPAVAGSEPRLQVDPHGDLIHLQRRQGALLHQDAALPIEDAMRAVAKRADPYAPWDGQPGEGER